MSIFDNSLEPVKRIRCKARERRLLATQNVKESLARWLGEEQDAFDHSPVSFTPDLAQHSVGILLVHGFTGSPHSMRPVAQHFMELGYAVEMPVLTGHATRWQDLRDNTYQQWLASAEQGYRRLTDQGLQVVVIGMSMGGTVATHLSAHLPVVGTVLINPYMVDVNPMMRHTGKVAKVLPILKAIGSDIAVPGVSEGAYSIVPTAAVYQLHLLGAETRALIPQLKSPVLYLRSLGDHTVSDSSHKYFLEHCSAAVEFRWLTRSYHVATLDYDAEYLLSTVQAFVASLNH